MLDCRRYLRESAPPLGVLVDNQFDTSPQGLLFLAKRTVWIGAKGVCIRKIEMAPQLETDDDDPAVFVALQNSNGLIAYVIRASGRLVCDLDIRDPKKTTVSYWQDPWSPKGTYIWANSPDHFYLFDARTGQMTTDANIKDVHDYRTRIKFSPDETYMAVVMEIDAEKVCCVYTVPKLTPYITLRSESQGKGMAFRLFEDARFIRVIKFDAVDPVDQTQTYFDLQTCLYVQDLCFHGKNPESVAYAADYTYECFEPCSSDIIYDLLKNCHADVRRFAYYGVPSWRVRDMLKRQYYTFALDECDEYCDVSQKRYAGIVLLKDYSDRTARLFRPCVRHPIFHLMCVRQRLLDAASMEESSLSILPVLPMAVWLHIFVMLEQVM